jgi:hypothetical protein
LGFVLRSARSALFPHLPATSMPRTLPHHTPP